MADLEALNREHQIPLVTAADDPVEVATLYNNGMLELCHEIACEKLGSVGCSGQVLIVGIGEDGLGRLDFRTGSTRVNGDRLTLDDMGFVIQHDPVEPESPSTPASLESVRSMMRQFAGGQLLLAYDASPADPR